MEKVETGSLLTLLTGLEGACSKRSRPCSMVAGTVMSRGHPSEMFATCPVARGAGFSAYGRSDLSYNWCVAVDAGTAATEIGAFAGRTLATCTSSMRRCSSIRGGGELGSCDSWPNSEDVVPLVRCSVTGTAIDTAATVAAMAMGKR